jgi:hypothetical protein
MLPTGFYGPNHYASKSWYLKAFNYLGIENNYSLY